MTVFTREMRPVPLDVLVAEVRARLVGRTEVKQVWVFGSYARGNADRYSDFDLAIVADSDAPFVERFRDYLDLTRLGLPVELLVYTPEEFADLLDQERDFIVGIVEDGVRVL